LRLTAALADTSYVDNAIRNKANAADVYTKAEVDELLNDVVRQVLNTLTLKILGQ
jgi:cell division septum initiation protein DivIVA